jgi:hypothetical protein
LMTEISISPIPQNNIIFLALSILRLSILSVMIIFTVSMSVFIASDRITPNGLQLPEGGDFEALHCQPSRNFDRSTKLDLTTEPPLLGRCCYAQ